MWRVYYDDGSTYGPGETVEHAPGEGVIAIAQSDADVGREILHRKDFYYWERGRWFGCDLYGLYDYLRRVGWRKVIAGRNTEYRNYSAIFDRACSDPALPPKTARLVGEEPKA